MNYELLSSLYYKSKNEYEQEYNNRFNSIASKRLNISIEENQCFYILTGEVVNKLYNIMVLNQKLDKLTSEIPGIALQQYIKKCLIDEIVLTNEIEGVVSTRKDINEILENVEDKNKRLTGLVNKYLNLCSEENIDIITCNDVRNIYNDLLWEEISEDDKLNLPDGVYFRKEGVDVLSPLKKVIHKGVMPEEKINLMMTQALNILNDRDIIPILRVAIFHYIFGYIHPFYDGNGRTSRFISSYLLSKELNTLTGFGLSYAIKENISQYYKGFKTVNEKKNKGDLTPFIISFLDILSKELESLNNSVVKRINIINRYSKVIEVMEKKDKQKQNIIYVIFQETLFGEAGIDVSSLVEFTETSKYKVTQVLKEYDDMLIKNKIGRKKYYSFDLDAVDEKYLD